MKKFALITGASGGIGQAIAKRLANEGYSLYLHYHTNEHKVMELITELNHLGGENIPIQADLSKPDGYEKIIPNIFSIDSIIHCSGASHYGLFSDLKDEENLEMMNLHVINPILLTKKLLPKLLFKGKGSILFISSIWGQTGAACEVIYSTVKGAQISFVKALSKELALNGIRVNSIAPGAVNTDMMKSFSPEDISEIVNEIPMGRMATPEDVADAAFFLVSDQSSYITGQTIAVNGGWYT